MKRTFIIAAFALMASVSALVSPASAKSAQNKEADRIETRDKLRRLLEVAGQEKGINSPFRQSDKQPFNFIGDFERSEEHTSELQSQLNLVCRLLLEKKN